MFKKRRGQAATEFIMTYGWALMIITVTMSAFIYTLVRPSEIVGASCVFTDDIECFAHKVTTTELTMELKNNAGRPINITQIDCTINHQKDSNNPNTIITPGVMREFSCDIPPGASVSTNELVRINVVIYYKFDGQEFPRTTEGNVIGYVTE